MKPSLKNDFAQPAIAGAPAQLHEDGWPVGAPAANDQPASGRARRSFGIGIAALGLGVAGALAWVAWAPLDEGVPAPGTVMVDTKRKPVQHLSGGLIKTVLVREGDLVKQGQPLIELDRGVARANFTAVRLRYLNERAAESRLLAEQSGAATLTQHADVLVARQDPVIGLQLDAQQQLFASRKAALQADLQAIEESVRGQQSAIEGYQGLLESRRAQQALLSEELEATRGLVKEGYAPRNRQLELERMVADTRGASADLLGNIARARHAISEANQRALQRRSEYRQESAKQLAEVLRDVQADQEKFRAAEEELDRMEIRSPAAGHVVGLVLQSAGAVIQPAQKLMDIVPEGAALTIEARVPPQLVDRIVSGQPVDIRFSSFAHSPHLVVTGKVLTVSADLLTDPQNNASYYLARVTLTPEGMRTLGTRQLQPGMPCELIFKTGERSLLTYLLHPLVKRVSASMKEE
jgi:protease secretion system membrane fusion protein